MKALARVALGVILLFPVSRASAKCAQIYYDQVPAAQPEFTYGRTMAIFLQNLLGHFPDVQQYVIPIEKYEKGQLDRCETSFYLGSYFDNAIPPVFFDDFLATKRTVVWAGYNVWQLGDEKLRRAWNVKYRGLGQPDLKEARADGQGAKRPNFFKYYEYQGETFTKFGAIADDGSFQGAADIVLFDLLDRAEATPTVVQRAEERAKVQVVSWARHSKTGERVPYALRAQNRWFVADVPFSYIYEEDRYLIFTDLLFDMLGEKPRYPSQKPAMVRFEDIHPVLPKWQTQALFDAARRVGIPYTISLIPIFSDPYLVVAQTHAETYVPMTERPEFVAGLKAAQNQGATIVMHGVTHQSDEQKNPIGPSGFDYEFWDSLQNHPMGQDSVDFVVKRLERGIATMEETGLKPAAWLTPHYQASPLDNVVFAQLFEWNVGRLWYVPFKKTQSAMVPDELTFDRSGKEMNGKRLPYFADLHLTATPGVPSGQFYPYEIHGDAYGQRIIPEDAGYIRLPNGRGDVPEGVGVDDILRILRRNRKLRDVWGSFFLHPHLVNTKAQGGIGQFQGDTREIERLLRGAKEMGYQFVNLGEWTKAHLRTIRPEPIVVQ